MRSLILALGIWGASCSLDTEPIDPGAVDDACSADLTFCDGWCVDTETDPTNCGGCGRICDRGLTCDRGFCGERPHPGEDAGADSGLDAGSDSDADGGEDAGADGGPNCSDLPEECNGLDDNCNDLIDEVCECAPGETQSCGPDQGECVPGIQTCAADASWANCFGAIGPAAEVCDGLDQDCDGVADNGVTNRCGGCGAEPLEVCDLADNDCNGVIDDGLVTISEPVIFQTGFGGGSLDPSLAWNGTDYAFTCDNSEGGGATEEVYFGLRQADGTALADTHLTVPNGGSAWDSTLISADENWAAVWTDTYGAPGTFFTLIAADGTDLLAANYGDRRLTGSGATLATDGTDFLVALHRSGQIVVSPVTGSGDITGDYFQVAPGDGAANPAIFRGNGEYGLAYEDDRDGNREIYFARLDDAYAVTTDVRISDTPDDSVNPALAWSGSEYWIAWADGEAGAREIRAARVNNAGLEIEEILIPSADAAKPTIAWGNGEAGLAWAEGGEIYAVRLGVVGDAAIVSEAVNISNTAVQSANPSLVWDGSRFAAAWSDGGEILFTRFTCAP